MRIVDLSFPIRPHFHWKVAPELPSSHAHGDNFQSTVVTIGCHAYTHVDAPIHFLPGDKDIASMPVDQWIGPAAVVNLTHLGDNGEVSAAELERHAGHVQAGDIVLTRAGDDHDVLEVYEDLRGFFTETGHPAGGRTGHLHASP